MSLVTPSRPLYAGPPTVPGYALGEFLGRGSSAVVWAGTSALSGERVAVKVFAGDRPPTRLAEVLEATDLELALSQRVRSNHVVLARERVELDDLRIALILDLADAGSLHDVVTIRGAVPLGEAVTVLTPLATALADLSEAGVVHGDLAPGNVLFTDDGRPVLADLSAARLVVDGRPAFALGTLGFTAPEVLAGRPPTPASDVWSLGALLWYVRTGGSTPPGWLGDLHWSHPGAEASPGSLEEATEAVGPELRPVLVRMLADDPEARPTAAEAALAIYRACAPEPVVLVGRHPDPAAAVTTRLRREAAETRSRTQLRAEDDSTRRRSRRAARRASLSRRLVLRRWVPRPGAFGSVWGRVALVGAVGLVLAAGMLGLLAMNGGPLETMAPAVAPAGPLPGPGPGPSSSPSSSPSTGPGSEGGAVAGGDAVTGAVGRRDAGSGSVATGTTALTDPALSDPTAVLQGLADVRAAALSTADPVALVGAETEGSAAYAADAATVARLREQRQRYRDLAFRVGAAQRMSVDAGTAVVRASIERSACTVEGEDGSVQTLAAAPGEPLTYTLRLTDGGWRLTDVGSG